MKKKNYIIGLSIVLLGLIVLTFYSQGYRIGSFGIGKIAKIEISLPLIHTDIFVDTSSKITTTTDNQTVSILLSPTEHQIIVSHPGYFPWEKKMIVQSGDTLTLTPIFVSQNASGEYITTKDPQYVNIKTAVLKNILPTKDNPKISTDGSTSLWVENNTILIKINDELHTVITPTQIIKNVDFYKNRSGAVIFSSGETIYVTETGVDNISNDNIQNIFPIYKGTDPNFIETSPNFIYVIDGTTLMSVVI